MNDDSDKDKRSAIKSRFEEVEQARRDHETSWQKIGEWLQPKRSFHLQRRGNELRRRRIVDTIGTRSGNRLAALLHGYLIDTHEPWIEPVLDSREATPTEARWFDDVERKMHKFLMSPRSTFRSTLMESVSDDVFFGNSVVWPGSSRLGNRPIFKSLPLFECFWAENDDGVVDEFYRRFKFNLKQAHAAYPTPKLEAKMAVPKPDLSEEFTFILAIKPRPGGRRGAAGPFKPFTSIVYNMDTDELALEGGFDGFPLSITRFAKQTGDAYGTGPGWDALPMVILLNLITETIHRAAEQLGDPTLLDLTGRLENLDTRPGAMNKLDLAELMHMEPGQAVQKLFEGGDPTFAINAIVPLRQEIELTFYVDWLRPAEGQPRSATEIDDNIDIRLQSLSGVTARIEQDKMVPVSDRSFDAMQKADMFLPAPKSIHNADIDWTYRSPLAIAQRKARLRQIGNGLQLIEGMAAIDPDVADIPDTDKIARDGLAAAGLPKKYTRSPDEVAARREQRRKAEEEQRQLENAQTAAGAARDAGQAIGSVQGQGV